MKNVLIGFLAFFATFCFAIEVGGHLSTDTTWFPEDSPHIVVQNIYVDEGVTLTIMPGTTVLFGAAPASYENVEDFLIQDEDSVAKIMYVRGTVHAIGTVQDSIVFDRNEREPDNMRWGNIVFDEQAPQSIFRYCKIAYAFISHPSLLSKWEGALCCQNGRVDISHCLFHNNITSIWIDDITDPLLIANNRFEQFIVCDSFWPIGIWNRSANNDAEFIIAYNEFYGLGITFINDQPDELLSYPVPQLFNYYNMTMQARDDEDEREIRTNMTGDVFGNLVIDSEEVGFSCFAIGTHAKGYVRRNTMVNGGSVIANGECEISDNQFTESGVIEMNEESSGDVRNNYFYDTYLEHHGEGSIENNVFRKMGLDGMGIDVGTLFVRNNTVDSCHFQPLSPESAHVGAIIENNIFSDVHLFPGMLDYSEMTFRYNYMNIALPSDCIDGGGNIIGDDPMFVDPTEGDYHLLPESPCIDAGYDSTGYMPCDVDNFIRVIDGDDDGIALIDIGAYEYSSHFQGGFEGHIYNTVNNEPIALAKVDIGDYSREYTDSLGYFHFSAPPETYTLNVHHIFEGDRVFSVEITEGETSQSDFYYNLAIPEDGNVVPGMPGVLLRNYPNPFNPTTTISFSLSQASKIELDIYNIKGQLVKRLVNDFYPSGKHEIVWCGMNEIGHEVSSGVYLCRLKSNGEAIGIKKMMLMK